MIKHGFDSLSLMYSVREFNRDLTAPNRSLEMACAGPLTSQHSLLPNGEHFLPSERCGEGHGAIGGGLEMVRLASRIARRAVLGRRSVITSDIDVIWKSSKGLEPIAFRRESWNNNHNCMNALAVLIAQEL